MATRGRPKRRTAMVVFPVPMPRLLKRVLKELAAQREKTMRHVLLDGWLRGDREALDRYEALKKEKGGD